MVYNIPIPPERADAFRLTVELSRGGFRIDAILLDELRRQGALSPEMPRALREISRAALKKLFKDKRIIIKGQSAIPSSTLAAGITYIDIVGFSARSAHSDNADAGNTDLETEEGRSTVDSADEER